MLIDDHDFGNIGQPQQIFERPVTEDDVLQFLLEVSQAEVGFETFVNAVADRIPGRPEFVLDGIDAIGEAAIFIRQNMFFNVLGRGIDFVLAFGHRRDHAAPMAIGEQSALAFGGRSAVSSARSRSRRP